jgi:hypothetical protein
MTRVEGETVWFEDEVNESKVISLDEAMRMSHPGVDEWVIRAGEQLLDIVAPLCGGDSGKPDMYIRGSTALLPLMGQVSQGFRVVNSYFQNRLAEGLRLGLNPRGYYPLRIFSRLAVGPRELDVRYRKRGGVTDNRLLSEIITKWEDRLNRKYGPLGEEIYTEPIGMSELNGAGDQRTFFRAVWKRGVENGEGDKVFAFDLGEMPGERYRNKDTRLRTSYDGLIAGVRKINGSWCLVYDSAKVEKILSEDPYLLMEQDGSRVSLGVRLVAWTRLVYSLLFFGKQYAVSLSGKELESYDQVRFNGAVDLAVLKGRSQEMVANNLLGISYNPYHWPLVAFKVGLLPLMPLGKDLLRGGNLDRLLHELDRQDPSLKAAGGFAQDGMGMELMMGALAKIGLGQYGREIDFLNGIDMVRGLGVG